MSGEAVKVAVRCRPFNQREKERSAKLVIHMDGTQTTITNPEDPEDVKTFAFDFSYWSHDGFHTLPDGVMEEDPGSKYASQERVFRDLGQGVLDNAFAGYNCSLFAYGQTGSGKSYSMVGYGNNKGIVPITCEHLFKTIDKSKDAKVRFQVTFSMLEIYNEQVRDLLNVAATPKGGLPIRQHPSKGFYVDGLRSVAVNSFAEIERRMDEGTRSRTVAATQMNATSSRAHTVVTVTFEQITKDDAGQETNKSSTINLVDLAGSERADSTGATGDRLKEGANINRSLTMLGNVISALAEKSSGKKNVLVPYRDSALTKLLQNALGGNSKTVMIAALSPADINYDETLSTLRYADRAKKIKNKAIVNENPTEKLIRELREENERLKHMLTGGEPAASDDADPAEKERMRKQIEEELKQQLAANERDLLKIKMSWDDKLKESREQYSGGVDDNVEAARRSNEAHIVNLNEDPMLSGRVVFFVNKAASIVGKKDGDSIPDVPLNGLSIQKKHAVIRNEGGVVSITPGSVGARVLVNGIPLSSKQSLKHLDRLVFGSNHLFYFVNPAEGKRLAEAGHVPPVIDYDFAQKELAQARGFGTDASKSQEDQLIQDEVVSLLPMVTEVNAISEELNKHRSFEIVLLSATAQNMGVVPVQRIASSMNLTSSAQPATRVMVKMKNLSNGNTWLWDKGKFTNRKFIMEELYQRYLDGEDVKVARDSDPFWEPPEDVLIGSASLYLKCLGYAMDIDERVTITDYKGAEEGHLDVQVIPCTEQGTPLEEDAFVDDPMDLIGKPYYVKIRVNRAQVHKTRYMAGLHVKYSFFAEPSLTSTHTLRQTVTPEFNHVRMVTIPSVDGDALSFFDNGCIVFEVWGTQTEEGDVAAAEQSSGMTTEELMLREASHSNPAAGAHTRRVVDLERENTNLKAEIAVLKRRGERLTRREKRVKELVAEIDAKPEAERDYAQFKRSVSAVYTGTVDRLRSKIQVLMVGNKMMKTRRTSSQVTTPGGDGTAAGAAGTPGAVGTPGTQRQPQQGGAHPSGGTKSQACVLQ